MQTKKYKIIYWVTTLWLALGMLSTGIVQITMSENGPGGLNSLTQLGYPTYLLTLLGIWKFLGVIAILVPKCPTIKEWAYAGFFFMMTGAIFSHLAENDAITEIFPAMLLLILTGISWYFRPPNKRITLILRNEKHKSKS